MSETADVKTCPCGACTWTAIPRLTLWCYELQMLGVEGYCPRCGAKLKAGGECEPRPDGADTRRLAAVLEALDMLGDRGDTAESEERIQGRLYAVNYLRGVLSRAYPGGEQR